MSGDDQKGFVVYDEGRYHAAMVFRNADSKTWTTRYFRRTGFEWTREREEILDMPDAQSDKELWLRVNMRVDDVLDELEAEREAAM